MNTLEKENGSSEGWQNLNALLRQRKLESDAEPRAATAVAGGPFSTAMTIVLYRFASLALKSRIDARKVSESVVSRDFQAIRIENLPKVFPHPQRKYPGIVVLGYALCYNVCIVVISGCGEP